MQYFGFDRPSFGIKTYGFGVSNSKLSADFTTGTYNSSGAAKTFADLFTFNRAGKAWLVKEAGLQEYAADVPRFDNGLLIEQAATNIEGSSLASFPSNTNVTLEDVAGLQGINSGLLVKSLEGSGRVAQAVLYDIRNKKRSIYAKTIIGTGTVGLLVTYQQANLCNVTPVWSRFSINSSHDQLHAVDFRTLGTTLTEVVVELLQVEEGAIATSPIPVSGTPVTRPADYLVNKITGTTVTGDWDSTLNISIVAGKLVHSGYGRIRSLEIN